MPREGQMIIDLETPSEEAVREAIEYFRRRHGLTSKEKPARPLGCWRLDDVSRGPGDISRIRRQDPRQPLQVSFNGSPALPFSRKLAHSQAGARLSRRRGPAGEKGMGWTTRLRIAAFTLAVTSLRPPSATGAVAGSTRRNSFQAISAGTMRGIANTG